METKRNVYHTIEEIMESLDSSGDFVLKDLSPIEEKAVALLLHYRAVIRTTHRNPDSIFPGENFSEMMEIGPEKYVHLAEKISSVMIPSSWKILNTNLLISGAVGAAIGGTIAGVISYLLGCG